PQQVMQPPAPPIYVDELPPEEIPPARPTDSPRPDPSREPSRDNGSPTPAPSDRKPTQIIPSINIPFPQTGTRDRSQQSF
ncbi:MAG: hypothetical protein WCA35_30160, partial [Kovacikia sp.]